MAEPDPRPAHHGPDGRFVSPWLEPGESHGGLTDFLRWQGERLCRRLPPDPPASALPRTVPDVRATVAERRMRVTWVGHSTFLIQGPSWAVLTDPVWSDRVSPVSWLGPRRFTPPGVAWDDLPRIDGVLLSHDHYDHLDAPTVRRLAGRFPELRWFTPLGYRSWFRAMGIERITELDWWETTRLPWGGEVASLPAQHWTRRTPFDVQRRLWCSWSLHPADAPPLYFGGDSGAFPGFAEIGARRGPFAAALLPIGAYEPRWFMRLAHMNPEDAVSAYLDLGGSGTCVGMHWGTFRLTDEDPLEPPARMREAWEKQGLRPEALWIPAHGESRLFSATAPTHLPHEATP